MMPDAFFTPPRRAGQQKGGSKSGSGSSGAARPVRPPGALPMAKASMAKPSQESPSISIGSPFGSPNIQDDAGMDFLEPPESDPQSGAAGALETPMKVTVTATGSERSGNQVRGRKRHADEDEPDS
ncbi:unnamed protein product, partial [Durusdinium trenchii]